MRKMHYIDYYRSLAGPDERIGYTEGHFGMVIWRKRTTEAMLTKCRSLFGEFEEAGHVPPRSDNVDR